MQTIYNPALSRKFIDDVSSIKAKTLAMLESEMDLSWLRYKDYRIVNTLEELEHAVYEMKKADYIAVDTETTGTQIYDLSDDNPIKDHIVGMSVSWKRNQGIYIPFDHTRFKNIDKRRALQMLYVVLTTHVIVTHNGLFDGKVFYDEGIKLNIKHDTMLIQFNLDSTVSKGSKGLKPLTEARYGYSVIELEDIFEYEKNYGLFRYVEEDLAKAYACADSDHTFMLFQDTITGLSTRQLRSYLFDIKVSNNLIRSEYCGKGIDSKLLPIMNEINDRDMDKIENLIDRYVGMTVKYKSTGVVSEAIYRFQKTSLPTLGHVMFDILGYPIVRLQQSGLPVVDKNVLKYLSKVQKNEPDPVADYLFKENIMSDVINYNLDWVHDEDKILIDCKKLRAKTYKLADLITVWRKLEKLKTSFFAPLMNCNYEGRYFSSISMTRAETARLIDFIQTLDKRLKRLIVPYGSGNYMIDYDYAQIEYRAMAGLSNCKAVTDQLVDPEADYHRIGGSLILGKSPQDITDDERHDLKSINFGIPYGIGAGGIVRNRYGIGLSKEDEQKYINETKVLLKKWEKGLWQIKDMLDMYRDLALRPITNSKEIPYHLKDHKISKIYNPLGRSRLFKLDDMSEQKAASIRRQAGNFPIQSFAREVFCQGFMSFDKRMISEGLMDIRVPDDTKASGFRFENKVVIMAYIHDECLVHVDKSVNVEWIIKVIAESTIMRLQNHPPYYTGISVVNNWYEGKDGHYEAPIHFIEELPFTNRDVQCDSPKEFIEQKMIKYIAKRGVQEIEKFDPDWEKTHVLRLDKILPNMKDYFITPRICEYIGYTRSCIKDKKNKNFDLCPWRDELAACIENMCVGIVDELVAVYPDGESRKIVKDFGEVKYVYGKKERNEELYDSILSDDLGSDDEYIAMIDTEAVQAALNSMFEMVPVGDEAVETLSFE